MIYYWLIWYILVFAATVFSLYPIISVLTKLAFTSAYSVRDRALGKYNIGDGISFMYEPSLPIRKYIKKYQIFMKEKSANKYFVGEWSSNVAYADYDLVVYNNYNKVTKIINVKEQFNSGKCTHYTLLPRGTSYVSLKLNKMDGKRQPVDLKPNPLFFVWLIVLSGILALSVDFLIGITAILIKRGLYSVIYFGFAIDWYLLFTIVALSVFIVAVSIGTIWLFFKRRRS